MTVGFNTTEKKSSPNTVFIVKNVTNELGKEPKTVTIFKVSIPPGISYDLLGIDFVSEADIRHSLLKGTLSRKLQAGEIIVVESTIDLLQFDNNQKTFLEDAGITVGLEVSGGGGSLSDDNPVLVDAGLAGPGISTEGSRSDHKHSILTGAPASNAVLAGNPFPVEGTSDSLSRSDHVHNVLTAAPATIGNTNQEGVATTFVRSDHIHALGGTVGGNLAGTLPNPSVIDLTISGQQHGDLLYFNGTNWVRLAAGTSGNILQTNGTGFDPNWVSISSVTSKAKIALEFALTEDIYNTSVYFHSWRSPGGDTVGPKRSGNSSGISFQNACSPIQIPFDCTVTEAILTLRGAGVQNGSVTYPVTYQTELRRQNFTNDSSIANINFSISNSFTVGIYTVADTNYFGSTNLSFDLYKGWLVGLKFNNGTGANLVGQTRNAFVTLILEEK